MKISGKISFFGGPLDSGMKPTEGLAYYEHKEADLRPDLFSPRSSDPLEGSSKRLRNTHAFYVAIRFTGSRAEARNSLCIVTNPKTGQFIIASLVDWGPAESTGRAVDASDAVGRALRLQTDDEVEIEIIHI